MNPDVYTNARRKYRWLFLASHFLRKEDREELMGDFIEVIIKMEEKDELRWNKYWFIAVKVFQLILAGFKMEYEHFFPKRSKKRN